MAHVGAQYVHHCVDETLHAGRLAFTNVGRPTIVGTWNPPAHLHMVVLVENRINDPMQHVYEEYHGYALGSSGGVRLAGGQCQCGGEGLLPRSSRGRGKLRDPWGRVPAP